MTYGSFFYTSLIYLSDYGQDFHGGRFVHVMYVCVYNSHFPTISAQKISHGTLLEKAIREVISV